MLLLKDKYRCFNGIETVISPILARIPRASWAFLSHPNCLNQNLQNFKIFRIS
jgi:hypothetical protein